MSSPTTIKPTAPAPPAPPPPPPSAKGLPSKLYNGIIGSVDKFVPPKLRPLWQHAAGPKTIFFWAPIFKWSLVLAGLSDLTRPADTISIPGCAALAATGIVWSRYSLVIIPKNYSLFAVNLFVGLTQCIQIGRAYNYSLQQKDLKDSSKDKNVAVQEK